MIETEQIGQPTLYMSDRSAAKLNEVTSKPRVTFCWAGQEQVLHISVPAGFATEYIDAFAGSVALHLIRSKDAWFTPVPRQFYALCILDDQTEPLLLGFTPYDWQRGLVPVITKSLQTAKAEVSLPDGSTRTVKLLVGGSARR